MPVAPYQRVAAEIRRRIAAGLWPPGHQLPSQTELAAELGTTRASTRRGMETLRAAGELEGSARARLFVAHPAAVRTLLDPDADWPYPTGDGSSGTCAASSELAARLRIDQGARTNWVRVECLDPDHRPSHLITTWWAGRRRPTWASSASEAELHQLTPDEAAHLGLTAGINAWRIIRTRYDGMGRPVDTADLLLPVDRWRVRLK